MDAVYQTVAPTRRWVFPGAVAFIVFALVWPDHLASIEAYLILGMMLLMGLPHGATDQRLFQTLYQSRRSSGLLFAAAYVATIGCYALLWWLFPVLAFAVFIALALYHFGQSNWAHFKYGGSGWRVGHYLLWGAGVLLTPILLHVDEAATIVGHMTGDALPVIEAGTVWWVLGGLTFGNLAAIGLLYAYGLLTPRQLRVELLSYGLLLGVALTHSLLLSFTIYFVFWHSLESLLDQVHFLRQRLDRFGWWDLFRSVLPTVIGALLLCGYLLYNYSSATLLSPALYGNIFVFISLLTLPHMLLVDRLYREWSGQKTNETTPPILTH